MDHPLPDSITEWGVLAVSASPQTGGRRRNVGAKLPCCTVTQVGEKGKLDELTLLSLFRTAIRFTDDFCFFF